MRADAHTLGEIFDAPIQYRVPLYQRPYVWERNLEDPSEDRLTPFWEDVRDTVARFVGRQDHLERGVPEDQLTAFTDHFFGAVVLGKLDHSFGGIPHQQVIDGQQRFTTVQLLVAAAHRLADQSGFGTTAAALRDLYLNPEKHEPLPDEQFKLRPTNVNHAAYVAVTGPGHPGSRPDDPANRIQEAYAYFERELAEWLADFPAEQQEGWVKALHRVLRSHLKFVVIELEEGDNAQEIFESLNAQGTPLLAIDLVKNYVFRRAAAAKIDLDELDESLWRELDARWWRTEQRQGRIKRPRAELFLMHWLTMRKRDEVPALGLFVEFQREVEPSNVPDVAMRSFVERFIDDARVYRGFDALTSGSLARRFFDRLALLDNTTLYPIALRLFLAERDGELAREERDDALRALESWLVRRLICDYTPKNYNRVTVEMLKAVEASDEPVHRSLVRFLREAGADTDLWPSDPEVVETLVSRPLYNRIKPIRRVRLLLEACELERRRASGGFAETAEQEAPQLGMSLTIEHVLPQSWRQHWPVTPLPILGVAEAHALALAEEKAQDELEGVRDSHLHLLGNLTLVTKKLNPSVSNAAWSVKRNALDAHSILHLNRDLVRAGAEWDEAAIDERGRELAASIVEHWPGPDRFVFTS